MLYSCFLWVKDCVSTVSDVRPQNIRPIEDKVNHRVLRCEGTRSGGDEDLLTDATWGLEVSPDCDKVRYNNDRVRPVG